jgi:hypothetical protein
MSSYEIWLVVYLSVDGQRKILTDGDSNPIRFQEFNKAYRAGENLSSAIYWDVLPLNEAKSFVRNSQVPVPSGR